MMTKINLRCHIGHSVGYTGCEMLKIICLSINHSGSLNGHVLDRIDYDEANRLNDQMIFTIKNTSKVFEAAGKAVNDLASITTGMKNKSDKYMRQQHKYAQQRYRRK